jgi:hypothetical protein
MVAVSPMKMNLYDFKIFVSSYIGYIVLPSLAKNYFEKRMLAPRGKVQYKYHM